MTKGRLPKKLYRVRSLGLPNRARWWAKAGGTMEQLVFAQGRIDRIRRDGGDAELYETTCDWKKVEY